MIAYVLKGLGTEKVVNINSECVLVDRQSLISIWISEVITYIIYSWTRVLIFRFIILAVLLSGLLLVLVNSGNLHEI